MTGRKYSKGSPTILLVNFHSARNAGDAALLEAAVAQLRSVFDHPHIIVSANYPDEDFLQTLALETIPSARSLLGSGKAIEWRAYISAYAVADLVISCAGNQFHTMGRWGKPLLLSALDVWLAHVFGKPFYVLPQTIGPLRRRWERALMGSLYRRARHVLVREMASFDLAINLGVRPDRLTYSPDLAFAYTPIRPEIASTWFGRNGPGGGSPRIGVTVINKLLKSMDHDSFARYQSAIAATLSSAAQEWGATIYFFPQVTGPTLAEDDRASIRQIVEQMTCPRSQTISVDGPLPPSVLKGLYGGMDLFLATRLHSGIFALGMSVPTIFIGYLGKTRSVLESLGLSEWLIDLNCLNEASLRILVCKAWRQRETTRVRLQSLVPQLSAQAALAGKVISANYAYAVG